jgi:predicted nucleic acid-binding protein
MTAETPAEPLPELVLDGSVTLAWSLGDESSEYAESVFRSLLIHPALVPSVWLLEVANGLLMAERRGRVTQAETAEVVAILRSLPIAVEAGTLERALGDVLHTGRAHGLTAYDAAYLELAMRQGLPLATLDDRLARASAAAGVPRFAPGPG